METIALLIAAALAACGAWFLYSRSRARSAGRGEPSSDDGARKRRAAALGRTSRFAAVEIKVAADSCDAAQALVGKAMLAPDAPALPLEGCDRHCRCAFTKRADRRQEGRRWSDEGIAAMLYDANERRKSGDRRRS